MAIDEQLKQQLLIYQKNEITEHRLYTKLASLYKKDDNRDVLKRIADDEYKHYQTWKGYTQVEVEPSRVRIWKYYVLCRVFGLAFGTKLMEINEKDAQDNYAELKDVVPVSALPL